MELNYSIAISCSPSKQSMKVILKSVWHLKSTQWRLLNLMKLSIFTQRMLFNLILKKSERLFLEMNQNLNKKKKKLLLKIKKNNKLKNKNNQMKKNKMKMNRKKPNLKRMKPRVKRKLKLIKRKRRKKKFSMRLLKEQETYLKTSKMN